MATQAINSLPYKGRKYDPDQVNAFPRYIPYPRGGYYLADEDGTGAPVVPQLVKDACAEECLELLAHNNTGRRRLQSEGVKSVTISDVSETYSLASELPKMSSFIARQMLKVFIVGPVPIV